MTGYVEGDLTDPDGADDAAAHRASSPSRRRSGWAARHLNLHGTGLDGKGLPVRPVDVVTGTMWLAAADDAAPDRRPRRPAGRRLHAGEPEHRRRPPRHAVRPGGRHPGAGPGGGQPAPADEPGPLPRPDRRGEPDRARPRGRRQVGEIQVADVPGRCEPGTGEINYPAVAAALRGRVHRRRRDWRRGRRGTASRARRVPGGLHRRVRAAFPGFDHRKRRSRRDRGRRAPARRMRPVSYGDHVSPT